MMKDKFCLFCIMFCLCASLLAKEALFNGKLSFSDGNAIKTPSVASKKLDKAFLKVQKADKASKKKDDISNKFKKFTGTLNKLTNEDENRTDNSDNGSANQNEDVSNGSANQNGVVSSASAQSENNKNMKGTDKPSSKEENEWPSDKFEDKPLPAIIDYAQDSEGAYRQFFDFLKAEDIMVPRIIDSQGRVGQNAQLSIATIPDEPDEVELSMGILVDFDKKYYTKYFLPKLKILLQNIADAEGEVTYLPNRPMKDEIITSIFGGAWKRKWTNNYKGLEGLPWYIKDGYILANVAGRYNERQNPFQYYKIKDTGLFCKTLMEFRKKQMKLCISFALLDEDNNEIQAFDWTLYPKYDHLRDDDRYCFSFQTNKAFADIRIYSWLIIDPCIINQRVTRPFNVFEFKEKIKVNDLKDIRAMKVSFKYKN